MLPQRLLPGPANAEASERYFRPVELGASADRPGPSPLKPLKSASIRWCSNRCLSVGALKSIAFNDIIDNFAKLEKLQKFG